MAPRKDPHDHARGNVLNVIVLCPGLDHVSRGFESWSRECFDDFSGRPDVQVTLCKGSGARAPNELVARTIRRDSTAARIGGRVSRTSGYYVEQKVFAHRVRSAIRRQPGSVVLLNDWHLAHDLARWRRCSGSSFGLVLCNGGADSPPFDHLDHVLQPRPGLLEAALAAGEPAERHTLLPLAARIERRPVTISADNVSALRARLGLPLDRPILLSVAALNQQKRLDYVVDEIGAMPGPRPFLMLAGQAHAETEAIRVLAERILGPDGYAMRTVPRRQIGEYYRAANAFVLASFHEGSPRVLVEALAHGLPCLAHDWDAPRYVLGDYGVLRDLAEPGALGAALPEALSEPPDSARRDERHRAAYERFSWDRVGEQYVEVLRACAPRYATGAVAA
jgi:1,2-diacylglycerol 3-alpha-glucosyltransferase